MTESPSRGVDRLISREAETPQYVTPERVLLVFLVLIAVAFGALSAVIQFPAMLFVIVIGIPATLLTIKYPFVGLLLYLGIFLYRPGEIYPALAPLRLEFVLGSFLLIISVVQQRLRTVKVYLPTDRVSVLLTLFFGAMLISVFASYEKTETILACRDFAKTLVLYLLIIFLVDNKKKLYALLFTYSLMIIKIAVDSLVAFYGGSVMTVHGVDRLMGATSAGGDPNSLATTMVVSMPLVFLTGRLTRNRMVKTAMILACVSMVVLVALTGSRGGVVALLAVLFFATILLRQRAAIIAASLVALPLVWFTMPTEYRARYEGALKAESLDEASTGRWEIWKSGLNMVAARPLTGVGAGAFAWANGSGDFGRRSYLQAHNVIIDIAGTTGLIGLTAWLLFLTTMIRRLLQFRRLPAVDSEYPTKVISQTLLLCLAALLIAGMFGHNTYRYHWYLMAALTVVMMRREQADAEFAPASGDKSSGTTPAPSEPVFMPKPMAGL